MRFVRLLRPQEYIKNLFVLIPLFFAGKLFSLPELGGALGAFAAFSLMASSIYIVNDVGDAEEDRRHPTKRLRPVASGEVGPRLAVGIAVVLAVAALALAYFLEVKVLAIIVAYLALNLFYSFWGKHLAIVDVACIALGFVLRVAAGTLASGLGLSQWLILMVFLLSMFLALSKRWDDLCLEDAGCTEGVVRKSLTGYSTRFVSSGMTFFATISTICYIIYTLSPDIQAHYNSTYVYLTTFWVILGNMRYLQIAFVQQRSDSPTRIMLHDRFLHVVVGCWVCHLFVLIYFR